MALLQSFLKDSKAQISAEMIIVMAALLGIAIVVVRKLTSSTEKASAKLDEKTDGLMNEIDEIDFNA